MNNDYFNTILIIWYINLSLNISLIILARPFTLNKSRITLNSFISHLSHFYKCIICSLSKVKSLFPSVNKIHNHVAGA